MGVIKLQCPVCGGKLEMDDSLEQGFCQYCGNKVLIKKDEPVQNITNNTITDSNVTIINGEQKDFEIKAGVLIKYIGEDDTVIIPNNVKRIGEKAFEGLDIIEVNIPNKVTEICKYAFAKCKLLKKVTIANNVTSIGEGAFVCCTSLEEIKIPDSVIKIGRIAFAGCIALKEIEIPNNITEIDFGTFFECISLKKVKVSNSVIRIKNNAFANCEFAQEIKMQIPSSVKEIGETAFSEVEETMRI